MIIKKKNINKNEQGFTLFEVIAVLVLIALLYATVGPEIWKRLETGKVHAVQTQLAIFRNCLDDYRLDMGSYPTTDEGLSALRQPPTSRADRWNGPYISAPVPKDPWGNAYIYRYPGERNYEMYDLYSYGADGKQGGSGANADISVWPDEERTISEGVMEN